MRGNDLINQLYDTKQDYPEQLADFYIYQDEQYINKYVVGFSKRDRIDEIDENKLVETMSIIDNNLDYTYKTKYLVYMKTKENGQIINVYYNNVYNGISPTDNGFIIDFINMLMF